jgi:hypothetical protein
VVSKKLHVGSAGRLFYVYEYGARARRRRRRRSSCYAGDTKEIELKGFEY